MRYGLLWYDPDPKMPMARKLQSAAVRFAQKFGVEANVAHINPDITVEGADLRLVPDPRVGPNHILVGLE